MSSNNKTGEQYTNAIRQSNLSIYDPIESGNTKLWIPTPKLEQLLNKGLIGILLTGLPLRTRSKVVKKHVCQTLGYPVPLSFRKTKPQFPGQCFDIYVQKSNNLQIWNEELSPTRRYVIIRIGEGDMITKVKVVTGDILALLDSTGTLTHKYQARLIPGVATAELISEEDTDFVRPLVRPDIHLASISSPVNPPDAGQLLPIKDIFERLQRLVGIQFTDTGYDQERNRGVALQRLVCQYLGYAGYQDDGQFPDLRHQLLEVKLQTSQTIDLGRICPNSEDPLDVPIIEGRQLRHSDVRYALFYAETDGQIVTLTHLFVTTGEKFFSRFPQCRGKIKNKKLQMPLPANFFADEAEYVPNHPI